MRIQCKLENNWMEKIEMMSGEGVLKSPDGVGF